MIIVGGGIGGLTLALKLHHAGIACRIYEAAPRSVRRRRINLLPHATKELAELGLEDALSQVAVTTVDALLYPPRPARLPRAAGPPCRYAGRSSRSTAATRIAVLLDAYQSGSARIDFPRLKCARVEQMTRTVSSFADATTGAEPAAARCRGDRLRWDQLGDPQQLYPMRAIRSTPA